MLTAFLLSALAQASVADAPRSVVVIVADDVALSDSDLVDTPNLDFLASLGVEFRRAYAHPICSPTRRSIFFGRWPGIHTRGSCGPPTPRTPDYSEFSLAKLMKGAGYATGLFGKWHLGTNPVAEWEVSPNLHGFDTWRAGLPANVVNCGGNSYFNWLRVDDGVSASTTEYQTTAVRDAFTSWWTTTSGPKFAYVAYQAAHKPFHVPSATGGAGTNPTNREKYELMIGSLDDMLGDMFGVIDLRDTYVFFLADNGTPSTAVRADQDPNKVKKTTFRDGVAVPLVVAGPGIANGVSSAIVHAVDVMSTIAELTGAPLPSHLDLDSRSFAGALAAPAEWRPERQWVFLENDTPGVPHDRAIATPHWKLRNVEGVEELYDLVADPDEEAPLDPDDPALAELVARMRALLADPSAWRESEAPLPEPARLTRPRVRGH